MPPSPPGRGFFLVGGGGRGVIFNVNDYWETKYSQKGVGPPRGLPQSPKCMYLVYLIVCGGD